MPTQGSRGETVLAEHYSIDFGRPAPGAGGGLPAFAAADLQGGALGLVAIQLRPDLPPPPGPLNRLAGPNGAVTVGGVMTPLAHGTYTTPAGFGGASQEGYYLICQAPPGPPVAGPTAPPAYPWSEGDLLDSLLRPMATALERLHAVGVTHRGIRPDNLFRPAPGASVFLGCGWATAPGVLQPSVFEPPYMAMCVPGGHGAGSVGDDVYALGITLLTLALGHPPMEGLDDEEVIRRKLDQGCFAAVTTGLKLTPLISDLLRGMLADDPEHRTSPGMLADPMSARGRRVTTRPVRRALRPLDVAGMQVWNARTVGYAIARNHEAAAQMLRSGEIDRWLRLHLGDVGLATRIDEITRQRSAKDDSRTDAATQALLDSRSDGLAAMRAVVAFDPLAPLCWRGTAVWPAAMGPALALAQSTASAATLTAIEEVIAGEVVGRWAELRPGRCDAALLRMDGRQHRLWQRQRGAGGGINRLIYGLNPLLRCPSPLLAGRYVANGSALLPALEAASAKSELRRSSPMDKHIAVFIAARIDLPTDLDAGDAKDPVGAALRPLRLLSTLQTRLRSPPLPGLAKWLVPHVTLAVEAWQSRRRRAQIAQRLTVLAQQGDLAAMLALLEDKAGRDADLAGLNRAIAELRQIDARIAQMGDSGGGRSEDARRVGQEVCVGMGLVTLVMSFAAMAL